VSDYPHRKGKYLRPTLVCLTAEAMGANLRKALLTAAAMQISEEWLLIHDDLEDNSLRRRGLPALHCLYDVPSAINAGDGLQNVMWKVLADNRKILGEKTTFRLLDEFYLQLSRTILGQMTEIRWSKSNKIYLVIQTGTLSPTENFLLYYCLSDAAGGDNCRCKPRQT